MLRVWGEAVFLLCLSVPEDVFVAVCLPLCVHVQLHMGQGVSASVCKQVHFYVPILHMFVNTHILAGEQVSMCVVRVQVCFLLGNVLPCLEQLCQIWEESATQARGRLQRCAGINPLCLLVSEE